MRILPGQTQEQLAELRRVLSYRAAMPSWMYRNKDSVDWDGLARPDGARVLAQLDEPDADFVEWFLSQERIGGRGSSGSA